MRQKSRSVRSVLINSRSNNNHPRIRIAIGFVMGAIMAIVVFTSSVCIAACAFALPGQWFGQSFASVAVTSEERPIGEFRRDLKEFVSRSKDKDDIVARNNAIIDLCLLHDQIVNDGRFHLNDQLKGFRAIAAARLKKCQKEVELAILREDRAKRSQNASNQRSEDDAALISGNSTYPELDFASYQGWLVEDMQLITQISGGPINVWKYTGGGNHAGPLCDYGPDLVRLIESTINPDFWRTNGGNGVIHYYQPLRILVISASSRVHDDLTDLLRTLRTNSR